MNAYVRLGMFCRDLSADGGAYSVYFNGFVIGCILVAGVAVGLQTYPEYQDESQIPWLLMLNCMVLLTFQLEVMVKLCAQVRKRRRAQREATGRNF